MENAGDRRLGSGERLAYIGSYAEAEGPGLYVCRFDEAQGTFTLLGSTAGLKNPTFLDLDEDRMKLYAIAEGTDASGSRYGSAAAYGIDPDSGTLRLLGEEVTVPASTCHITLDRTRRCIMVSSYHGGMIGMNPLMDDGRIGAVSDVRRHSGSSVLPVQSQARAHSITIDRHNRYAVVCDLGLDRVFTYRLDLEACRFVPHRETAVAPGAGPRHFAFHPSYRYAYAINELNSTITVFSYDEERGELGVIQTVPTLPSSYQGDNACADLHLSPDGRFLYGSNRGHDSLVVFAADPSSGLLEYVEHVSAGGAHPRNFALSPDGRYVTVANRDTNNVVTLKRDPQSGRLTPTGHELQLSKPVCVKFLG